LDSQVRALKRHQTSSYQSIARNIEEGERIRQTGTFSLLDGALPVSLQELFDRHPVDDNDIVLIGGSLIEGIGNVLSDLDVIVISERPLERHRLNESEFGCVGDENEKQIPDNQSTVKFLFSYFQNKKTAIDFRYYLPSEIDSLITRANNEIQNIWEHTKTRLGIFDFDDCRLIHRLFSALPVQNGARFAATISALNLAEYCFYLYRSGRVADASDIKDVVGSWKHRQKSLTAFRIRDMLEEHAQALTHLHLSTSHARKWLPETLTALAKSGSAACGLAGSLLYDVSRHFRNSDQYIHEACEALDLIFDEGRSLLDETPKFMDCTTGQKLLLQEYNARVMTNPTIDMVYAFKMKQFCENSPRTIDFLKSPDEVGKLFNKTIAQE
tara:strand:+ start:2366 stop:3517 length:1152 start_codon:yes stop_codon:yes gene_type:complete